MVGYGLNELARVVQSVAGWGPNHVRRLEIIYVLDKLRLRPCFRELLRALHVKFFKRSESRSWGINQKFKREAGESIKRARNLGIGC